MQVLDPGHEYALRVYDGYSDEESQHICFVKREGVRYPGNQGKYAGTNCQEILRVLIDRVKYLDKQIPCAENKIVLENLRSALTAFEVRAARRHKRELKLTTEFIEDEPTCSKCGHIHDPIP